MKNSVFGLINLKDVAKGLFVAVVYSVLAGVYASLQATPPHFPTPEEIKIIEISAAGVGVAYLLKNLFTNSSNQLLKKEKK